MKSQHQFHNLAPAVDCPLCAEEMEQESLSWEDDVRMSQLSFDHMDGKHETFGVSDCPRCRVRMRENR